MIAIKLICDGYNIMEHFGLMALGDEVKITLAEARERLLGILNELDIGREIKLIFDGVPTKNLGGVHRIRVGKVEVEFKKRIRIGKIEVIFTEEEDADHFIQKIVDKDSIVITRDRELSQELEKAGVEVHHPRWLDRWLSREVEF